MPSIAELVGKAVANGGKNPLFEPGRYSALYVEELKGIQSWDGKAYVVVNMAILDSDVPSRPAGTRISHLWNIHDKMLRDYSMPEIKAFIGMALGLAEGDVEEYLEQADIDKALDENGLKGRLISATATLQDKKKSEGQFTKVRFSPVSEEDQAAAEEAYAEYFAA